MGKKTRLNSESDSIQHERVKNTCLRLTAMV